MAMGGQFTLMAYPQPFLSMEEVETCFLKAEKEVARIENLFTEFRESEITKINNSAGKHPVVIDQEVFDLILYSLELSKDTKGVFDITHASYNRAFRDSVIGQKALTDEEVNQFRKLMDYSQVELNLENLTIFFKNPDLKIGLGGIGKGYAVDRVYQQLLGEGLINFCVNGNGDIRVHAHKSAPRPWRIGIRNPFSKDQNKNAGFIEIYNGSVSTSGSYFQNNNAGDPLRDHHILSKRNLRNISVTVSATIFAETCTESDSLGTFAMAMPPLEAIQYFNKAKIKAILIDDSGKTHLSKMALSSHYQNTSPAP